MVSQQILIFQRLLDTHNHMFCLQVWGLFAPKFVFDVAGLILTDILVCLASHYYFSQVEDDALQDPFTKDNALQDLFTKK